ncbi:hypothetical protein U0070_020501, partial [Myodes glareolus]
MNVTKPPGSGPEIIRSFKKHEARPGDTFFSLGLQKDVVQNGGHLKARIPENKANLFILLMFDATTPKKQESFSGVEVTKSVLVPKFESQGGYEPESLTWVTFEEFRKVLLELFVNELYNSTSSFSHQELNLEPTSDQRNGFAKGHTGSQYYVAQTLISLGPYVHKKSLKESDAASRCKCQIQSLMYAEQIASISSLSQNYVAQGIAITQEKPGAFYCDNRKVFTQKLIQAKCPQSHNDSISKLGNHIRYRSWTTSEKLKVVTQDGGSNAHRHILGYLERKPDFLITRNVILQTSPGKWVFFNAQPVHDLPVGVFCGKWFPATETRLKVPDETDSSPTFACGFSTSFPVSRPCSSLDTLDKEITYSADLKLHSIPKLICTEFILKLNNMRKTLKLFILDFHKERNKLRKGSAQLPTKISEDVEYVLGLELFRLLDCGKLLSVRNIDSGIPFLSLQHGGTRKSGASAAAVSPGLVLLRRKVTGKFANPQTGEETEEKGYTKQDLHNANSGLTGELKSISKLIPMARRKQYFERSQVQQLGLYMDEEQDEIFQHLATVSGNCICVRTLKSANTTVAVAVTVLCAYIAEETSKEKLPHYYKNISLSIKMSKAAIEGTAWTRMPFHSNDSISGVITKMKMQWTIVIHRNYLTVSKSTVMLRSSTRACPPCSSDVQCFEVLIILLNDFSEDNLPPVTAGISRSSHREEEASGYLHEFSGHLHQWCSDSPGQQLGQHQGENTGSEVLLGKIDPREIRSTSEKRNTEEGYQEDSARMGNGDSSENEQR